LCFQAALVQIYLLFEGKSKTTNITENHNFKICFVAALFSRYCCPVFRFKFKNCNRFSNLQIFSSRKIRPLHSIFFLLIILFFLFDKTVHLKTQRCLVFFLYKVHSPREQLFTELKPNFEVFNLLFKFWYRALETFYK
jgi:hypothetical protein